MPNSNVTIPVSSSNVKEGIVSLTSLIFTTANYNKPQTVFVTGVNDFIADGDIDYTIVTGITISTDTNFNGLNPADVDITNVDNDSAGITVSAISGNTNESGLTASFTIVLDSMPNSNVTIPVSSSNVAEGIVSPTSLIFTTANYNIPQTVSVTGVDDFVADGNMNYTIVTGNTTSADPKYNGINPNDLSITNIDVGEKRTFLSSSALNGSLGGVAGADTLCNSDAGKPSILPNIYKAMLVDGVSRKASATANAGDGQIDWVLLPNTAYFRSDGTTQIMTANVNGIFNFSVPLFLTNSFLGVMQSYWTGLNSDWTTFPSHCNNWTTTIGNSRAGDGTPLDNNSIIGMGNIPCNSATPYLLCVQQ
jgi:hypothetical protein